MTAALLWELLGKMDPADIDLPVVAITVQRRADEGIERVESLWQFDGPFLAVKTLDPAIAAVATRSSEEDA